MKTQLTQQFIPDEVAMLELAKKLSGQITPGDIVYLQGPLGAGKTAMVRGILRALGFAGKVKSPSYTLVETYIFHQHIIHHFDFYRLKDPEEVEHLGLSDYLTDDAICLIEWPEHAKDYLPVATLCCTIAVPDDAIGRLVSIQ